MWTRSLFLPFLLLLCSGCKNNEEARPPNKPTAADESRREMESQAPVAVEPPPPVVAVRLVEVDCSPAGAAHKGWSASAPQGAACKESADALIIGAGDAFQLVIHEAKPDMAARKKAIESDPARKFKRYTTDKPDAVVYETDSGTGKPEYHFFATKKLDHTEVTCEDAKGTSYTQAQADAMVQACQSLTKK
jgi:uncharacterized lipoprotein